MHPGKFFTEALYFFLIICLHNVRCTEVTVTSYLEYFYLGVNVSLPVFLCHPKHTGYKEVIWKKDFTIVQNGSSNLRNHVLSVASLVDSNAVYDNLFRLQGYYWCETDVSISEYVRKYLFQIKDIHTFVGKLVAKHDSLGEEDSEIPIKDKISRKMGLYEDEIQGVLFKLLPHVTVSVTTIKVLKEGGLEVHFYLYVRKLPIHPRTRSDNKLVMDEDHFLDIQESLLNETSLSAAFFGTKDWLNLLDINIADIELRSTLGCYEETHFISTNSSESITWPGARIGDVVFPDNACLSKNGLSVTRLCTGSFDAGAKWGIPSGECEKPANKMTMELKRLYDNYGRYRIGPKIESLITLTSHPTDMVVSDLHFVAEILKKLSLTPKLDQQEIRGILSVIDQIMDTNQTELVTAKKIIRLTSRVLRTFQNILQLASEEEKEIRISMRYSMVDTKYTKMLDDKSHVLGLAVVASSMKDTLYNGSVQFLLSSDKVPKPNSIAHFLLPQDLVLQRESDSKFPCQVNMIFFKDWNLFQNPKGLLVKRNYVVLPTPVMYVSISGGPAFNLTDPVKLYFKDTVKESIEKPVCVYYDTRLDEGAGAWSTEGCEFKGLNQGYYQCQCYHLSIFAVILSRPYSLTQNLKLGTSVYVACGVSILALSLAVVLYILSKNWRKTVDHSILFCLSLTFLACIILIFISESQTFMRKPGCVALALIFHYIIFAMYGWLLVHAVVYRLRFAKKTDVSEIPHFMIKAALSVWGVPIIIVFIIWLTKDFLCPVEDSCWLTVYEVAKVSIIPIVVLINITLCINLCATYSLTCRYKKDFLVDNAGYNDVAMKFRVSFTIFAFFVSSWLFGLLALHYRSKTLRILFSICVTLTAYYVTLFFIFQEVSFWDLCQCCKQKKEPDAPPVQYNAKSYNSTDESNKTQK